MADADRTAPTLNDAARALADEHGLDVAALVEGGQITATGKTGDVLKGDVEAYLDAVAEAEEAEADAPTPDTDDDGLGHFRLVEGQGQLAAVVAGAHRLLHPGARYRLPSADPAVRALLDKGTIVEA